MDVQVVGSVYGAALYVTHYIYKDELQALKQVIAEQLASLQQDATMKQRLRKIGNTLLSHHQLSQQKVHSCSRLAFEGIIPCNCLRCN